MHKLADEVQEDLLSRLAAGDICRSALCCVRWAAIVRRESFWRSLCERSAATALKRSTWREHYIENVYQRFDGLPRGMSAAALRELTREPTSMRLIMIGSESFISPGHVPDWLTQTSAFLRRFCEDTFVETPPAGSVISNLRCCSLNGQPLSLQLCKTAGQEPLFAAMAGPYFAASDGVLLMFDVDDRATFDRVPTILEQVHRRS